MAITTPNECEVLDPSQQDHINMRVEGKINGEKNVHVYILDAYKEEGATRKRYNTLSLHYQKQKSFRELIEGHFKTTQIKDVIFGPKASSDTVIEYFQRALRPLGKDDLLLLYYHGGAGFNGEDYSWKFSSGNPKADVDAYELIKVMVKSGVDCLLILDAYVPSRFHARWKTKYPEFDSEHTVQDDEDDEQMNYNPGMVEIISRGERLVRPDGNYPHNDKGDFTTQMCLWLDDLAEYAKVAPKWVKNEDGEKLYKLPGFIGLQKPLSIPEFLAKNKELNANPQRIWLTRPKRNSSNYIHRFVLDPEDIRETGKIGIFAKQIQGKGFRKHPKGARSGEDPETNADDHSDGDDYNDIQSADPGPSQTAVETKDQSNDDIDDEGIEADAMDE